MHHFQSHLATEIDFPLAPYHHRDELLKEFLQNNHIYLQFTGYSLDIHFVFVFQHHSETAPVIYSQLPDRACFLTFSLWTGK